MKEIVDNITVKVIIESKMTHLPLLRQTVRGICSNVIDNEKIFQDIDLSLNEALSNVIFHAYQNEPDHEIQITVTLYPEQVVFEIVDLGLKNLNINSTIPSFDEDSIDIDSLAESGRGMFLIHQLMDEVIYKPEADKNILILRKRFK